MGHPIEFSPKVRSLIYSRTRGHCEKCGQWMSESQMCVHHRKLKSQGGRGNIENGLGIHHQCHNLATDSVHSNPWLAYIKGWMVQGWNDEKTQWLVLPSGESAILTSQGTYILTG